MKIPRSTKLIGTIVLELTWKGHKESNSHDEVIWLHPRPSANLNDIKVSLITIFLATPLHAMQC